MTQQEFEEVSRLIRQAREKLAAVYGDLPADRYPGPPTMILGCLDKALALLKGDEAWTNHDVSW